MAGLPGMPRSWQLKESYDWYAHIVCIPSALHSDSERFSLDAWHLISNILTILISVVSEESDATQN